MRGGGTVGGRTMLPAVSNTSMKSSSSSEVSWVSPTWAFASGKRIQREPYCSAGSKGDNLYNCVAFLAVANISARTPYKRRIFFLDINFPGDYPFKPPKLVYLHLQGNYKIAFKTRIYHCNVDGVGNLSMDILKESWSPALTIAKVLIAIRSILTNPNPYETQVPGITRLYLSDRAEHDEVHPEWTLPGSSIPGTTEEYVFV